VATTGLGVRNAWIGGANVSGIRAVALAGEPEPLGAAALESLGGILGVLEPSALTEDLGSTYAVTSGYFKRHASCSYTHPPADAALIIHAEHGPVAPEEVERIEVETHHLAAHLTGTQWQTRLGAMFSIPYVVAAALRHGGCPPMVFDPEHRADPAIVELAARVRVSEDPALDARLPTQRAARVTVRWTDGTTRVVGVDNPVGDADHHPLTDADLIAKSMALLGGGDQARAVHSLVDAALVSTDVSVELTALRALAASATNGAGDPTLAATTRRDL